MCVEHVLGCDLGNYRCQITRVGVGEIHCTVELQVLNYGKFFFSFVESHGLVEVHMLDCEARMFFVIESIIWSVSKDFIPEKLQSCILTKDRGSFQTFFELLSPSSSNGYL